jgi:hypothetical protein
MFKLVMNNRSTFIPMIYSGEIVDFEELSKCCNVVIFNNKF